MIQLAAHRDLSFGESFDLEVDECFDWSTTDGTFAGLHTDYLGTLAAETQMSAGEHYRIREFCIAHNAFFAPFLFIFLFTLRPIELFQTEHGVLYLQQLLLYLYGSLLKTCQSILDHLILPGRLLLRDVDRCGIFRTKKMETSQF